MPYPTYFSFFDKQIIKEENKELFTKIMKNREVTELANLMLSDDGTRIIENEYICKRFWYSAVWYMKKAKIYKILFYLFSVLSITLPAISSLLISNKNLFNASNCNIIQFFAPFSAALGSISSACIGLFKFQQQWIQYRRTAERLKKELSLFISRKEKDTSGNKVKVKVTSGNKVKDKNSDKKKYTEEDFLTTIEEIMASENDEWHNLYNPNKGTPSSPR